MHMLDTQPLSNWSYTAAPDAPCASKPCRQWRHGGAGAAAGGGAADAAGKGNTLLAAPRPPPVVCCSFLCCAPKVYLYLCSGSPLGSCTCRRRCCCRHHGSIDRNSFKFQRSIAPAAGAQGRGLRGRLQGGLGWPAQPAGAAVRGAGGDCGSRRRSGRRFEAGHC